MFKENNMDEQLTSQIDRVLNYKTYTDKQKIERLLKIDANMYCNLGSDSTKTEKLETKRRSRQIYRAIKTIDNDTGNLFLQHMDK